MNKLLIIIPLILLNSCRLDEKVAGKKLNIVATTGIIADGLTNIVGDSAYVDYIMGPNTDPHIYKPTSIDIELLDDADVIVANGLHLEGKMAEMLDKYSQEKPVIKVSDGIKIEKLMKVADFDDAYDPHIWFDPILWSEGLSYVTLELGKLDTIHAGYFSQNMSEYSSEIMTVHEWIISKLATLKDSNRVLITSHDAFNYFGERYNIDVKGIQGISTLSEVGLKDISTMVEFVVSNKIQAIFTETATSDKTAKSIQDGAKAKGHAILIKGPLYADALGEPHENAGTYLGMIKENVNIIIQGLQGE